MKRFVMVVAMTATAAWAESPSDFTTRAEIATASKDAIHRITLPIEMYRDAKADFSDLRIFNGAGEELPFAFAGEPDVVREELPPISLPMFPVAAAAQSAGKVSDNLDVVVKSSANGTIVSVQGRAHGKPAQKPAAWLLDASQVTVPIRALDVDWDAVAGTEIVRVSVDASDDLKTWRRVASQSQLVHLEQGGMTLEQKRVDIGAQKAKYLRVVGEPAGFSLKSVAAIREQTVKPAARLNKVFAATAGTRPGEYLFDLGARLPIEALRVVVGPNTIAPFNVSGRDNEKATWVLLTSSTFYRLTRGSTELESPPIEVQRRPVRYVSIQLDSRSPGIGAGLPQLEVQWRPAQIVFVARGNAPYILAAGNDESKQAIMSINQLMPDYKPGAEMKISEDTIAKVTTEVRRQNPLRVIFGDVNPKKAGLWAVLLAAVLVLGWMALRLARQMKATPARKD